MTQEDDRSDSDASLLDTEQLAPENSREHRLIPWRRAGTDRAVTVVNAAVRLLEEHEATHGLRQRARRLADRESMVEVVNAIVSDLSLLLLTGCEARRRVSLSKEKLCRASRYKPAAFGQTLPDILRCLSHPSVGIIGMSLGRSKGFDGSPARETTITIGPKLLVILETAGVGAGDWVGVDGEETVILRSKPRVFGKERYVDDVEYVDNAMIVQKREQLARINRWLAAAHIEYDDPEDLRGSEPMPDLGARRLRRVFSQGDLTFQSGGRLYGGWWQNVKAAKRIRGTTINGGEVVELDYGQVGPRILYGEAKAVPPAEDLYSIPGFEKQREGVKRVLNAMLCRDGRMTRFPKGDNKLFPRATKVGDVVEAIENYHVDLRPYFGTSRGHHLQFIESEIMVDVLEALMGDDIVALPIHDALLIQRSDAERTSHTMRQAFLARAGVDAVVTMKG